MSRLTADPAASGCHAYDSTTKLRPAQETVDGGWKKWAKCPGPDPDGEYGYFDIRLE